MFTKNSFILVSCLHQANFFIPFRCFENIHCPTDSSVAMTHFREYQNEGQIRFIKINWNKSLNTPKFYIALEDKDIHLVLVLQQYLNSSMSDL